MSNYNQLIITALIAMMIFISCNQVESSPDSAEVLDKEQQRIEYLASESYDQLSDMLSPTMSYTHSNAIIENKEEFLEELRSGRVTYRNLNHQNLDLRFINPTTAIINGISDVSVTVEGEDLEVPLRFTIVYTKENGEWLFEAWHSVRLPK